MDGKMGAASTNMNTFEPTFDLIQEEECDTLLLYLPGFTKEQLRVQLARSGVLKISGTMVIGNNKWTNFQKDFPLSANCDTNKITAKFEGGILYVRQPKLIVPAEKEEITAPPSETPQPQAAPEEPTAPKTDQEQATTQKTTPTDDNVKQNDSLDNSVQKKEAEPTKEKEKEKEKSSEELEGAEKAERNHVHEKTGSINDDHQGAAARSTTDKSEKISGNIDADQLVNKGTNRNAIAKIDDYKLDRGSPAAKLKMARQKIMTMVLAVLFAFALGMYVSNLVWFSKTDEN